MLRRAYSPHEQYRPKDDAFREAMSVLVIALHVSVGLLAGEAFVFVECLDVLERASTGLNETANKETVLATRLEPSCRPFITHSP